MRVLRLDKNLQNDRWPHKVRPVQGKVQPCKITQRFGPSLLLLFGNFCKENSSRNEHVLQASILQIYAV